MNSYVTCYSFQASNEVVLSGRLVEENSSEYDARFSLSVAIFRLVAIRLC